MTANIWFPHDVDEIVVKYCRWCAMKEEESLQDLFKETQLHLTSIHLHALIYSVFY